MPYDGKADVLAAKAKKLDEQKRIADEMNKVLGDLNEVSRRARRDLSVAIVVAQRPGYHNYYQPPEEAQSIIQNDTLKKLSRKVERIQSEIDSIDEEIAQQDAVKSNVKLTEGSQVNSLQQWLKRYGEAGPSPPGYYSTFEEGRKVYGGTKHHKAFRSQSTVMKKGIMTR